MTMTRSSTPELAFRKKHFRVPWDKLPCDKVPYSVFLFLPGSTKLPTTRRTNIFETYGSLHVHIFVTSGSGLFCLCLRIFSSITTSLCYLYSHYLRFLKWGICRIAHSSSVCVLELLVNGDLRFWCEDESVGSRVLAQVLLTPSS